MRENPSSTVNSKTFEFRQGKIFKFEILPETIFWSVKVHPKLCTAMVWPAFPYHFVDAKEYYEKAEDAVVVSARTRLRDLHRTFRARILDVFDGADRKSG